MTLEEMDAELARMGAYLKWLREDSIAELDEELERATNPYLREFLLQQKAWFQAQVVGAEG